MHNCIFGALTSIAKYFIWHHIEIGISAVVYQNNTVLPIISFTACFSSRIEGV